MRKNRLNFGNLSATASGSRFNSSSKPNNSATQQLRQPERMRPNLNGEYGALAPYPACPKYPPPSRLRQPPTKTQCLRQTPMPNQQHPQPTTPQPQLRYQQRQHSQTLTSCQRQHCQMRKRASKQRLLRRNMYRKNLSATRTRGIAKILSLHRCPTLCVVRNDIASTLRTLLGAMGASYTAVCIQFGKRAQQVFENICEVESSKRLKIRVSLVRFQSRPPIRTAVLRCRTAVFLILASVKHAAATLFLLATRWGAC